jgi:hypothetical protein
MPSTEPSALNVTSIDPIDAVTGAGIDSPENEPSSGAAVVLPSYTFTKSYVLSVLNAANVSVTVEPVWMSHEHCESGA